MNTRMPLQFLASTFLVVALSNPGISQYKERERSYDVLHYAIDIRIDEVRKNVEGTVTMGVVPLHDCASMDVDAAEMTIRGVLLSTNGENNVPVKYATHGGTLTLGLPRIMTQRDTLAVTISYACTPRNGLYFTGPDAAYLDTPLQVWTQGEPEDNHFWMPCYDSPNDKATVEMRVTVNKKFIAISNGALLEVTPHPEDTTTTYHWYSAKPFASYLISLVIGEYVELEQWYKNIPLQYYVYPGQKDDAMRSFSKTPDMVKFFSEKTRFDYPWPKYAQTVVANFTYNGMENASAATLTDKTIHSERAHLDVSSDGLVAHELAHQWFGDVLTCSTWAHAWLNEGFATYFGALYMEHDRGWDEFQHEMLAKQHSVIESDTGADRRPTVTDHYAEPFDVFDNHIYARGACILHMLRFVLGDEVFWKGIQHYVDLHQYEGVSTTDFQQAMEEASQQDLQWFFDEWVMRAGYPVFAVSTSYNTPQKKVRLVVRQMQHVDELTPLYRMPVSVEIVSPSGTRVHRVTIGAYPEQVIELPSEQQPVNIIFDKGGWLLKQLDHEKPAEAWLLQLQQGDVADRETALRSLEPIIEEQKIHSAVAHVLAHDSFWGVRRQAAETLGWFHDPQVVSLLAPAFRDPEARVRLAATASLRDIRSLDVLVALGTLVESDSSFAVVGEAITSLATIDSANGMTYCKKGLSLDSHNSAIRAASAKALATLKSPEAKNLLMTLTEYGQPLEVRLAAIEALADTWPRDGRIRQRLEELLQDRIQRVRRKSIEKLGTIASPTSQKPLQEFLKDEADAILRREVRRALVKIDRAGNNTLYH